MTSTVRRYLIPLALLMTLAFIALELAFGDDQVVAYQPVMYAIPLVLVAPTLLAVFRPKLSRRTGVGSWVAGGIIIGVTAAALLLVMTVTPGLDGTLSHFVENAVRGLGWRSKSLTTGGLKNWIPGILPLLTLGLSAAATLLGIVCSRGQADSKRSGPSR